MVEQCKRVTLVSTLYKVYASALAERLKEEVDRKGIILYNQTRFRRRMGTVDNIYVINYVVGRELAKREGNWYYCLWF